MRTTASPSTTAPSRRTSWRSGCCVSPRCDPNRRSGPTMPSAIHLIVHAKAAADVGLMAAVEDLRRRGVEVVEALTGGPGAAARLAEAAARGGAEAGVAAGGGAPPHA